MYFGENPFLGKSHLGDVLFGEKSHLGKSRLGNGLLGEKSFGEKSFREKVYVVPLMQHWRCNS
jgi:hypothetical protein